MSSLRLVAVCGAALALLSVAVTPEQAQARPQYRKVFGLKYPDLKEQVEEKKCAVCHPVSGKNKINNDYGITLKKQLEGKKNEKDEKKLDELLTKIEGEKSKTPTAEGSEEMKTFGELIKEGKLPGTDQPAEEEKKEG